MKRYNVKIKELKITEFDLNAKNKSEAKKMVEDVINNTSILGLPYVNHKVNKKIIVRKKFYHGKYN